MSVEARKELGQWIAKLRDDQGLTQQQASERIGISRTQLCRWEAGTSIPGWDICQDIADAYRVDVQDVRAKCGYAEGTDDLSAWASSLARRIEKRSAHLSHAQRQAVERAIDSVLTVSNMAAA